MIPSSRPLACAVDHRASTCFRSCKLMLRKMTPRKHSASIIIATNKHGSTACHHVIVNPLAPSDWIGWWFFTEQDHWRTIPRCSTYTPIWDTNLLFSNPSFNNAALRPIKHSQLPSLTPEHDSASAHHLPNRRSWHLCVAQLSSPHQVRPFSLWYRNKCYAWSYCHLKPIF